MPGSGKTSLTYPPHSAAASAETLLDQDAPTLTRSKAKRVDWFGLLPTAFVVVISLGLGSTLLFWLLAHQVHSLQSGLMAAVQNGTFYVNEGTKKTPDGDPTSSMQALTFSAVASHLISITSSFLMTLVAYRISAKWLSSSEAGQKHLSTLNPTPIQYGLVLDLLGTASFPGLYRALRYAFRKRSRRAVLPRMFVEALSIAAVVVSLTHALGVADFYLHSTSVSILVSLNTPLDADPTGSFGLAFNQSIWPEFALDLKYGPDWQGPGRVFYDVIYSGWRIAYNLTAPKHPFKVITLATRNDSAILVPLSASAISSSNVESTAFTFPTFGARATCRILTGACTDTDHSLNKTACNKAGYPYLPFTICYNAAGCDSRVCADVNGDLGAWDNGYGQLFPDTTIPSNPVKVVMQLKFFGNYATNLRPDEEGIFDVNFSFLGTCSVEFFNVTASYDPTTDSFGLLDQEKTNSNTIATLWLPLLRQYVTDRLIANLQGTFSTLAVGDTAKATALLNQEMARLIVGSTGGFYMTAPALSAVKVTQAVLGAYPVSAVLTVVGIPYAYAAFAIFIFLTSMTASSYSITPTPDNGAAPSLQLQKHALVLGQTWLTNSLPLIGFAFPDRDTALQGWRSIAEDPVDMTDDIYEERLVLGIHQTENGTIFGVQRRNRTKGEMSEDS